MDDLLFDLPDLDQGTIDAMEPIEFGYPQADGVDILDNIRTNTGNEQGPLPQKELDAMTPSQLREVKNQRYEAQMGWAKPVAQFLNAISSPATAEGMVIGPINAVSKLGNALGDVILRKEIDTSDAWQIDQDALAPYNPLRGTLEDGSIDTADTSADPYGYELGGEGAGEALGVLTGGTAIRQLKRVPQLVNLANKARQTQRVKNLAVAAQGNKYLRRGINLTRWGGEAMVDTSLAALYQDADLGNTMDLLGLFGVDNAPLMTQEENNYLENFGNKVLADGILLPLGLIGASQVAPFTRRLADGPAAFGLDELGQVELEPYVPRQITQPQLPPAAEQFDSAIDRTTAAQTQVQAVQRQRDRVEAMGLILKNTDGQYAFDITGVGGQYGVEAPTPEMQPSTQRVPMGRQTSLELDYEFGDAPDPRPEVTTYLAELDELSDQDLIDTLRNVDQSEQLSQRQIQLEESQSRVTELQDLIADIEARMALPEGEKGRLTEQGGKRKLNKAQTELDQLQLQVSALAAEPLQSGQVGEQLAMRLDQQVELDLTEPGPELPEIKDMTWDEEAGVWRADRVEGGYPSAAAYRNDLEAFPRDLLRKMAAPKENPELAAIVRARTGKRVWSAKKSDIIDAFVELADRRGRYVEKAEQLPLELQQTLNLNEEPVPQLKQKQPMSADEREQLKRRILEIAIENGEVQPDVTPIPDLPATEFNQGELIETLFEVDETGQMLAFSYDELPTYKASGKKAEALIEEMRQRFEWALLDGQAQRAAQQQMAEQMGWNKLTWEEKKRSGLISQGFYAKSEGLVQEGTYTATVKKAKTFEWTPAGPATAEQAAAMKPKAPSRKRKAKETTSPQVKNARKNRETAEAKVAALKAQLAKATCDG